MTVAELYEWAKERDLLDKQIAKHFNFSIADVNAVYYLTKEEIMDTDGRVVID
jgi:hypothetical protein